MIMGGGGGVDVVLQVVSVSDVVRISEFGCVIDGRCRFVLRICEMIFENMIGLFWKLQFEVSWIGLSG